MANQCGCGRCAICTGQTNNSCPPGAKGATGTILGFYVSEDHLRQAHPTGPAGSHYLVGRDLYGFDPNTNALIRIGPLTGPKGPPGPAGTPPNVSIGANGNWYIGGVDTGRPARGSGQAGGPPNVQVGTNGNWIIGGVDSGVPAKGAPGNSGGVPAVSVGALYQERVAPLMGVPFVFTFWGVAYH
jgi:hypothetical protein